MPYFICGHEVLQTRAGTDAIRIVHRKGSAQVIVNGRTYAMPKNKTVDIPASAFYDIIPGDEGFTWHESNPSAED